MDFTGRFKISALILAIVLGLSSTEGQICPKPCKCTSSTISCRNKRLQSIQKNYIVNSSVETLDYSGNKLESLIQFDFTITGVTSIKNLYLNDSNVALLTQFTFVNLTELVYLDLSENILEQVPSRLIQENRKIKTLKLSMNFFRKPPELISESLESLDISSSHLEVFGEKNVINLPNLRYINLQQNKLQYLSPNTFTLSHNLISVDLSYNNWRCNCTTAKLFDNIIKRNLTSVEEPIRCRQGRKKFIDIYTKEGAVYFQKYCLNTSLNTEEKKVPVIPNTETGIFSNLTTGEEIEPGPESRKKENLKTPSSSEKLVQTPGDEEAASFKNYTLVLVLTAVFSLALVIMVRCLMRHRKKTYMYRGISTNSFEMYM